MGWLFIDSLVELIQQYRACQPVSSQSSKVVQLYCRRLVNSTNVLIGYRFFGILCLYAQNAAATYPYRSTSVPSYPRPSLAYLHFTQRRNRARSLAITGPSTWPRLDLDRGLDTAGPAVVRLYWLTPYGGTGAGADRRWDFRNFCQKLWIAVEAPRRAL